MIKLDQLLQCVGAFQSVSMSESDGELSVGVPSPISASDDRNLIQKKNASSMEGYELSPASSSETNNHNLDLNDGSTNDSGGAMNRNPTCSLCRNHGVIRKLKGHKRYCPWKHCMCQLCRATNRKRKVNAAQVAQRRAQAQDEQMGLASPTSQPVKTSTPARRTPSPKPVPRRPTPIRSEVRDLNTHPTVHREDIPKPSELSYRPPNSTTSPLRSADLGCQPGPIAFAQQVLLACTLIGQNVSFLRESLRLPQVQLMGHQEITFLDQLIRDSLSALEEASFKLNDVKNGTNPNTYQSMPFRSDMAGAVPLVPTSAPLHHYPLFPTHFRAPVIVAPQDSHFQPYGGQCQKCHKPRPCDCYVLS